MVKERMLRGVISMPSNIFATTGTNVSIIFLDREHNADDGYQQAIDYAIDLDVPFAYATNGIELIEKESLFYQGFFLF